MEVIVTHDVSDFDGIAASIAALKLYPQARMLRRRIWPRQVRAFVECHGGRFVFQPLSEVELDAVTRLILVDVRRRSRLEPDFDSVLARADGGDPGLSLHIYDHHPDSEDDLHGEVEVVEPIGAVTTAFTETFRERDIVVDPLEATLMALGIYSDTGNLTYDVTTARDADAVAWLLRQGANLTQVSDYLRPNFRPQQRELLSRMLTGMDTVVVDGAEVGICIAPLRRSISDMPIVTTHVCQLADARNVFGIFPIGSHRVQIIGRSDHGLVDIGAVLKRLGGGGNSDAGSANLRDVPAQMAKHKLVEALHAEAEATSTTSGSVPKPEE